MQLWLLKSFEILIKCVKNIEYVQNMKEYPFMV